MSAQRKAKPSLTLVRRYKAPVEKVYAAWTDPEKIKAWWGPAPSDVTYLAEADLRVGGALRVAFRTAEGEEHEVRGIYREIETNRRLVFSWAWRTTPERESQVTLLFKPLGAETELTIHHEHFVDEAARDSHNKGWSGALDKLGSHLENVEPARFENALPRTFVGFKQHFTNENMGEMPVLWRRLGPHIGKLPGQRGGVAYGIVTSMSPKPFGFDYIAAVETAADAKAPEGMIRLDLPAQLYAVFACKEHISQIRKLMDAAWRDWLPRSERLVAEGAAMIEVYDEAFDPATGEGGFEMWLPLRS